MIDPLMIGNLQTSFQTWCMAYITDLIGNPPSHNILLAIIAKLMEED